jgi:hypothetical protein
MTATARNTFSMPLDFEPKLSGELEQKINAVLFPLPSAKATASVAAKDVLFIVRGHAGARRAITIGQIIAETRANSSRRFGALNERSVKAAVKELVEVHGLPIGSSRGEVPGYYLIVTPQEAEVVCRVYEAEIRSLSRRVRTLRGMDYAKRLLGQVAIDFTEGE